MNTEIIEIKRAEDFKEIKTSLSKDHNFLADMISQLRPEIHRTPDSIRMYGLLEDGVLVSGCASRNASRKRGKFGTYTTVLYAFTARERRGLGYASSLIETHEKQAIADGYDRVKSLASTLGGVLLHKRLKHHFWGFTEKNQLIIDTSLLKNKEEEVPPQVVTSLKGKLIKGRNYDLVLNKLKELNKETFLFRPDPEEFAWYDFKPADGYEEIESIPDLPKSLFMKVTRIATDTKPNRFYKDNQNGNFYAFVDKTYLYRIQPRPVKVEEVTIENFL